MKCPRGMDAAGFSNLSARSVFGIVDGSISTAYDLARSEEQAKAARQAKRDAEQAEQEALDQRLASVRLRHPGNEAVLAVLDHHRPERGYEAQPECKGCDEGGYAQSGAYWPCSTVVLLNDGTTP